MLSDFLIRAIAGIAHFTSQHMQAVAALVILIQGPEYEEYDDRSWRAGHSAFVWTAQLQAEPAACEVRVALLTRQFGTPQKMQPGLCHQTEERTTELWSGVQEPLFGRSQSSRNNHGASCNYHRWDCAVNAFDEFA